MTRIRVPAGWFIALGCLFVILIALPLAIPAPVNAYWKPQISSGPPKDPGTPFEEPESGDPDTGAASGPETRPGHEDPTAVTNAGPGLAKVTVRQILLKNLVFLLLHP